MKKLLLLVGLFTVLFATAQTQDTLYVWKAGVLVNIQSIKSTDMDSITFKRPTPVVSINQVTICNQIWSTRNLDVTTYSDGTPIPQVTTTADWANLTTGAWCYYNNDPANGAIYGKLYNWYATAGIYDAASQNNPALRKKLTPNGWHVPSDAEWTQLTDCLGGESVAGGKMKATGSIQAGTGFWQDPNTGATNSSGFTGLPGGCRFNNGIFNLLGYYGYWWSSTEFGTVAWYRSLDYNVNIVPRNGFSTSNGFSVRCVKD
jgi:uncharacterized protein (TIGR02145 family)